MKFEEFRPIPQSRLDSQLVSQPDQRTYGQADAQGGVTLQDWTDMLHNFRHGAKNVRFDINNKNQDN